MSTYLDNLGITFPDSTTQTTAYVAGQAITGSAMDTQDYHPASQSAPGVYTATWTKPVGTYNWVWVQLWGGGGGATGTGGNRAGGGYTSVKIPYSQVPPSVAISIPPNSGSGNGGGGTPVSATGFHPLCSANGSGPASTGIPATQVTQAQYQYLAPTSVVYTIVEAGSGQQSGGTYSQLNGGGPGAAPANGNNPGGGGAPNGGNGGTYGGYARIVVKTFYQDPTLGV